MMFATVLLHAIVILFQVSAAIPQPPVVRTRDTPIAVGDVAPDFTLEGHNGQKVSLSEARGKSPVVLVFYRGYW